MPKQLTQNIVIQWLSLASGTVNIRQVASDLNIISTEGKSHLRVIFSRCVESGLLARTPVDGVFRKIDNEKKLMDWEAADPGKWVPLQLPFDIHKVSRIYPKSVIIVAGGKNEGKSSFLFECIKLNTSNFQIDFYNSETGPEQLKQRLTPFNFSSPAPFKVYERYDNFAEVIEPDHLSIIDYLDLNSEVYLVGTEIDAIFRKLTTGVAIIGLQKPPASIIFNAKTQKKTFVERDLAYGGGFSAKRAVLYISLSLHKLKLVYVKTPADPKVKPNNMSWSYNFDESGRFCNIDRYFGEEE